MELVIVIVNYRTPRLVVECLGSLEGQLEPGKHRVVIVDNASNDRSTSLLNDWIQQKTHASWVTLVASPTNAGFSAGNNLGIKAFRSEGYLLINSDTFFRSGAIRQLLRAREQHPDAGIIAPRLEGKDGTPQVSCFRDHAPLGELIAAAKTRHITTLFRSHQIALPLSDMPMTPDWVSFACVWIRRAVIEDVGLLDEGYFMYWEDSDYCRRARDAGWDVLYWPTARVVHLRGGTSPVKSARADRRRPPKYLYASRARYFAKFYGWPGLISANLLWLAGRAISLGRELTKSKKPHTCEREAVDIWTNWRRPMKRPAVRRPI